MRVGLLLLAAAACVSAELTQDEMIREVLFSWKNNEGQVGDHWQPSEMVKHSLAVEQHGRSKRAASPFHKYANVLKPHRYCTQPGYTGEFCEFPICIEQNMNVVDKPDAGNEGANIDSAYLGDNCTRQYVTVVDETMSAILISLSASAAINPNYDLVDADGKHWYFNEAVIRSTTQLTGLYRALPPNTYYINPTPDVYGAGCVVQIKAKTSLTIQGGFIKGDGWATERSDYPDPMYTYQNTLNTFVVHAANLRAGGSLKVVGIYEGNAIVSRPQPLRTRFGCSYEYYYESFYCRNTGYYYYIVEGVTFMGYPFRRQAAFRCLNNPNPVTIAPTTPAPTSPTDCGDRGILIDNNGSAYCMCLGLWTGTVCDEIVCMNGGTPNPISTGCVCTQGFGGAHCETMQCIDFGKTNFNVDEPTMVFVVRVGLQMKDIIAQIQSVVHSITNSIEVWDPTYINRFGVVFFRDNVIEHVGTFNSLAKLDGAFDTYANLNEKSVNCSDIALGALAVALQSIEVSPKSVVYVISDAMPNDYKDNVETVFALDSYFRVPIYFLYVAPQPGQGCTPSIDDPGYRAMNDITQRTMGMAAFVTDRNVGELMYAHLFNTFYRSQLLLTNDAINGQTLPKYQSVSADAQVQQIVVVAKGADDLVLYATSADFKFLNFTKVYHANDIHVWVTKNILFGQYVFNFITESQLPLSYRVYQKSYHNANHKNSQYEMFWAFTPSINADGPLTQPVVGVETGIAVHLKNYPAEIRADRVRAELLIYAQRDGKQEEIYMSNGVWRDGCDFQFYFPPFKCMSARENLHFQFYAQGDYGYTIQRSGSMYCSEYHPTFQPPTACQNGGVMSSDNITCFCPPGFTGNKCEQILCMNGGTPNSNYCACPPGFDGKHCQIASCFEKYLNPTSINYQVDMIFAIEMTQNAYGQVSMLNKNFHEIVRDIATQHPNWIRNIVLLGFNSTWGGLLAEGPLEMADVVSSKLNQIATTGLNDTGCTVNVWGALGYVIRERGVAKGSFINLFIASKPDDNDIKGVVATYTAARALNVQITAVIGYQAPNGGSFYCDAHESDYQLLHDACRFSNGETYFLQQATVSDFVRTIPMKFSSGTVVHRRFSDCTSMQYVSIPIDSYTQTIQLNIQGHNSKFQLMDGYGNEKTYPNLRPLATDSVSGWGFYNMRRDCDPDWQQIGDWCLKYSFEPLSYNKSRDVCRNYGGFLVDDVSSDKHQFLMREGSGVNFWFGLHYMNDGWYWDRAYNMSQYPLTNATTQYWDGGNVPTFADWKCAYFSDSGLWFGDECKNERPFICQKHAYNYDIEPTDINANDLPAGKWLLGIQTDAVDPMTSNIGPGCFVEVKVQSHLQVFTGYTEDIHSDFPDADPVTGSTNNHLMTFVDSAGSYRGRDPILTHGLIFNAHNDTMYDAVTFAPRSLCAFDWISQNFACPDSDNSDNLFSVMHLGEDEYGYTFQRIVNGHCSKPVISCGNGGLRYNGTCVCSEYWQGKYCTIPICQNNATYRVSDQKCLCVAGYEGPACQFESCTNRMNTTFFSDNGKSLIILLEESRQSLPIMNELSAKIDEIINATVVERPGWFSNYILATFNSQGVQFNQKYTNVKAVASAINSRIMNADDEVVCVMPLYTSIAQVFANTNILPDSPLLLITSSVPSDKYQRDDTFTKTVAMSPHIHYLYIPDSFDCESDDHVPTEEDGFIRYAYATDGNFLYMNALSIGNALSAYLPTLYKSNVLLQPTVNYNFTWPYKQWFVSVDNNSTDIYVTVVAESANLSVINPLGESVVPDSIFTWKHFTVFHIDNQYAGIYTMTFSSNQPSYVNVASTGGPKVLSGFVQTTSADPTGVHNDNVSSTASLYSSNVAVFHLIGTDPRHKGFLTHFTFSSPNSREVVYDLYRRESCNFEFYSDPFDCPVKGQRNRLSSSFLMIVNGVDELGQSFRRQVTGWCYDSNEFGTSTTSMPLPLTTTTGSSRSSTPFGSTTTTMPTTTPNIFSVAQADIVFVLDLTATGQKNFADYSEFIIDVLDPFTVSQAKIRVGFVPIMGSAGQTIIVAPLSAIDSPRQLSNYLNSLNTDFNDYNSTGQYLGDALKLIAEPVFTTPGAGYRSEIDIHLVVVLTSNIKFSDDATTTAKKILSSKKFAIFAVSYPSAGPSDMEILKPLVSEKSCAYAPRNIRFLNTEVLDKLQRSIINDGDGLVCSLTTTIVE